jgi:hypothetical protein
MTDPQIALLMLGVMLFTATSIAFARRSACSSASRHGFGSST